MSPEGPSRENQLVEALQRLIRGIEAGGRAALLVGGADVDEEGPAAPVADARDYDAAYYVRLLRDNFASRLARALAPDDFAHVFADPEQPSLFEKSVADIRPVLTRLYEP